MIKYLQNLLSLAEDCGTVLEVQANERWVSINGQKPDGRKFDLSMSIQWEFSDSTQKFAEDLNHETV